MIPAESRRSDPPVESTRRVLPPPLTWSRGRASRVAGQAEGTSAAGRERRYLRVKRLLDILVAGAALLLLWPLFLLVALAIVCDDRGPVFYRQIRVGRYGRRFTFWKFRSMVAGADAIKTALAGCNEAEGPIFKMRHDPRVTRVGRFLRRYSIDELPQLINVLRGDMSLVGPRPHLPSEVACYTLRQRARLSVLPGLVCWREVSGRSCIGFERWIEMDLCYIERRSLRTDLTILLRVIPALLRPEGAY